ncbi:hypothetical protein ACJX0J_008322, partial [Zea mays]
ILETEVPLVLKRHPTCKVIRACYFPLEIAKAQAKRSGFVMSYVELENKNKILNYLMIINIHLFKHALELSEIEQRKKTNMYMWLGGSHTIC